MRFSTLARYALRAMVDLALNQDLEPVSRSEIARRQEISGQYLAQLFAKLKRAGLVQSVLGPGGGYVLTRSPSEMSAGDVLRAVDESTTPVYCAELDQAGACHRADGCATRLLWARVGAAVAQVLDTTTLAELCDWSRELADSRFQAQTHAVPEDSAG